MFRKIDKHMNEKVPNPAESFLPSQEDKFPNLTAKYWANPNAQRGEISVCSYYTNGGIQKSKSSEGI